MYYMYLPVLGSGMVAAAGMYQCLRGLRSSHLYPSHRIISTQCINYLSASQRGRCSVLEAACSVWLMQGREDERPDRRLRRMDTEAGLVRITLLDCYSLSLSLSLAGFQPLSSGHCELQQANIICNKLRSNTSEAVDTMNTVFTQTFLLGIKEHWTIKLWMSWQHGLPVIGFS